MMGGVTVTSFAVCHDVNKRTFSRRRTTQGHSMRRLSILSMVNATSPLPSARLCSGATRVAFPHLAQMFTGSIGSVLLSG